MTDIKRIPELTSWLTRLSEAEKPPDSVIAYNVGLFEANDGYSAYLIGAESYDEEDCGWACDEAFTPAERYCPIPKGEFIDWRNVHVAAVRTMQEFLVSAIGKNSFLASAKFVTVGFDDGDLEQVKLP